MRYGADELEMLIEEYLGGTLSGEARASFERAMSEDAEIAEAVALQRALDGALRRAFVPPCVPSVEHVARAAREAIGSGSVQASTPKLTLVGEGVAAKQRPDTRRWKWMAIAAAVILTSAGVFRGLMGGEDFKLLTPDQMYLSLQNDGWKPAQVCNTPVEFAALVKKRLGAGLLPDMAGAATSGVALLGWGYEDDYNGSPLSKKTMMLLTTVNQERVLVLIDQKKNRRKLEARPESPLQVHEQVIGSLVVYEVTAATKPSVLPLLSATGE